MECIRQLLLRSGEALFLLQLLSQHHITRVVQGLDASTRQSLVQLTFHQLVCSEEGDRLATMLIAVLMEVKQAMQTSRKSLKILLLFAFMITCNIGSLHSESLS